LIDETVELEVIVPPATEDSGEQSDETLAARGGVEGFIQLYRRYLTPVYRYLYARVGGNRQEAEDVTSLVFERAWASIGSYRPVGSFRGWLFTIARRTLADYYRGGSKGHPVQIDGLDGSVRDPATGPEESAMLADQVRGVLRALASLGEEQREIVTLRFMAGLKYGEIAALMGKREAAVKMVAYRALEEIRRRYRDGEF
jgi:RNA polymerase sigma-70 factor (ECF subfamily)